MYSCPVEGSKLPEGSDSAPRNGAQTGMYRLGLDDKYDISSGWGLTKDQVNRILNIWREPSCQGIFKNRQGAIKRPKPKVVKKKK
jgi:hypothetical protein